MTTASIITRPDGFTVRDESRTVGVRFADVAKIDIYKRDEGTTDLVCCDVTVESGNDALVWILHEEMPGFEDLLDRLEQLPGFRRDWRKAVILPPFAENRTVAFRRGPTEGKA